MQYVYVLTNPNGQWYAGCTKDLKKRLTDHNKGQSTYTKHRGPFKLIYYEACIDPKDAYAREKYLKTATGKRYIRNRLKRYLTEGGTGESH